MRYDDNRAYELDDSTAQGDYVVERVGFAIIEGSSGTRAAEHAKEFQTANWRDALRSARAAIAAMQQAPVADDVRELVRPLQWSEPHPSHTYPNWYAYSGGMKFESRIDTSRAACFGKFPLRINGCDVEQKFETIDEAKAYAEDNYRMRVMSLLNTNLTQPQAYAAVAVERALIKAALEPFAKCVEQISGEEDDEEWAKFRLLIKDYRRAAKALEAIRAGGQP